MYSVSFSQYSIWKKCPYQWKLIYIDRIGTEITNIHLVFGSALHKTLQIYLETFYNKTDSEANALNLNEILLNNMLDELNKYSNINIEEFINKNELNEYYLDGIKILKWFKKNKSNYFYKRNYELIGIEFPINYELFNKIKFYGKIDFILKNKKENKIKIIDFKKSYYGWRENDKKDLIKTGQLKLYKYFYSLQYNVPLENIEIEFLIFKQKINENLEFNQKYIQKFSPPSGKKSINEIKNDFENFIKSISNENGLDKNKLYLPTPSKENCKYCPFKSEKEICKYGVE